MLPVISAVAAAHEAGILHRDLKPENIFLARQKPWGELPMLLDFGISKAEAGGSAKPLTAAGELLGTPPYMAPEQVIRGMQAYDARSDQYALGVVIYECVTGTLPFVNDASVQALMVDISQGGARAPSFFWPQIPPAFDALVARAMSVQPEARFPSVLDLGRALFPFASARTRALWSAEFEGPPPSCPRAGRQAPVDPAALRVIPWLADAPGEELARLVTIGKPVRAAAGAALFDQGARGGSSFFVLAGEVDLSRTHGADTWEIDTAGPGAVIALAALWEEAPRPVSAVARGEVTALEIDRAALDQLGAACPEIAGRLHDEAALAAARRLRDAGARVAELLDRPSVEASREALVRLAAAIGEWSAPVSARPRRDPRRES
jgi:CRP-like cAMP-binding protein